MTTMRLNMLIPLFVFAICIGAGCGDAAVNNAAPNAILRAPTWVKVGQSASLDGTESTDADGDIVSYHFVVADGTSSHRAASGKTDHHFLISGLIEVSLIVTDSAGQRSEARRVISVRPDGSSQ
mgnify:CR=1 FL=1